MPWLDFAVRRQEGRRSEETTLPAGRTVSSPRPLVAGTLPGKEGHQWTSVLAGIGHPPAPVWKSISQQGWGRGAGPRPRRHQHGKTHALWPAGCILSLSMRLNSCSRRKHRLSADRTVRIS